MGDIYRKLSANEGESVAAAGTVIHCRNASNPFHIQIGEHQFEMDVGDQIGMPEGFDGFRIEETQGAVNTIELVVLKGKYVQGKLVGTVSLDKLNAITTSADVALNNGAITTVKAANTNRREIMVTALAGNASNIRVGDASTGAARGLELQPGQTVTLTTTDAVYAYSPTGTESVSVLEVEE